MGFKLKYIAHYLLLFGLVFVISTPIIELALSGLTNVLIKTMIFLIILSGISIISQEYRLHRFVRFGLMLVVAAGALNYFSDILPVTKLIASPIISIFLFVLTVVLISTVIRSKEVTVITLIHSMSGYLLLGMSGSIIITLINEQIRNAYTVNIIDEHGPFGAIYHSFVTLTTLGYGDISPTHTVSQSFAVFLALSGVFYMGFLVAALVGVYISNSKRNE
jgi:hypothetical protein